RAAGGTCPPALGADAVPRSSSTGSSGPGARRGRPSSERPVARPSSTRPNRSEAATPRLAARTTALPSQRTPSSCALALRLRVDVALRPEPDLLRRRSARRRRTSAVRGRARSAVPFNSGDTIGRAMAHDHRHRLDADRRALLGALAIVLAVMGAEIAAGIVAHSLALLADAG